MTIIVIRKRVEPSERGLRPGATAASGAADELLEVWHVPRPLEVGGLVLEEGEAVVAGVRAVRALAQRAQLAAGQVHDGRQLLDAVGQLRHCGVFLSINLVSYHRLNLC